MKLAIIGTAGRGDDARRLSADVFLRMVGAAARVCESGRATTLVSGGAAWADHVAVDLHITDGFPCEVILPSDTKDVGTARHYHRSFSRAVGRDTWMELLLTDLEAWGRFKDRNTVVADRADMFLAMTFGRGPRVKDGGTADTVRKMLEMGKRGWHYDLNGMKLYQNAIA